MGLLGSQLMSESIQFYYTVYTYVIHCFQIDQYSENYKKTKYRIFVYLYLINNYMITAKIIIIVKITYLQLHEIV